MDTREPMKIEQEPVRFKCKNGLDIETMELLNCLGFTDNTPEMFTKRVPGGWAVWRWMLNEFSIRGEKFESRNSFVDKVLPFCTEREIVSYKIKKKYFNALHVVEEEILFRKLIPFVDQAILQAVGTIPVQVAALDEILSPEELNTVNDWCLETMVSLLSKINISKEEILRYWGLNS